MAVTISDALTFVGATSSEQPAVQNALNVAGKIITEYLDGRDALLPVEVLDRATLEVTATVLRRGHQPGGQGPNTVTLVDGSIVREPANPLTVTRGLLDPWLLRGIG